METLKKVFMWIKEQAFLITLVLVGVIFLTCTGNWNIYGDPIVHTAEWCKTLFAVENVQEDYTAVTGNLPESTIQSAVSDADVSGDELLVADVSHGDIFGEDVSVVNGEKEVSNGDAGEPYSAEAEAPAEGETGPGVTMTPPKYAVSQNEMTENKINGVVEQTQDNQPRQIVYKTVEDDYFADALFIGDSRTVGMYEYGGLKDISTFYATTGLTIHKVLDASIVEVEGQFGKITVEEALQQKQFANIYFMLGINEMGTGTVDTFMEKYSEVIARIKELQPDATIYLQGIMQVTTRRSEKGDYIHIEGINARNEEIAKLADNEQVYYLDVNSVLCDEEGGLESSYTSDGVHLKAQYISIWKEFLKEHVVVQ